MVKSNHVTVQEIIADIGGILNKINFTLYDHEHRLHQIEELNLNVELGFLRRMIAENSGKKQIEALQAFKNMCNKLGIQDIDSAQSLA